MFEKNKKIVAFSYFNFMFSSFLEKRDIAFIRCDLREVANMLGKNKIASITEDDIQTLTAQYCGKVPFAIDIPLLSLFSKNEISIENLFSFAIATKADFLSIDLNYFDFDIIKKAISLGLRFVAYSSYNESCIQSVKEKAIEFQAAGGILLILEDFPENFIQMIHGVLEIPIISDSGKNCDGYYFRIEQMFGLTESDSGRNLNLKKMFLDMVDEKIFDAKK